MFNRSWYHKQWKQLTKRMSYNEAIWSLNRKVSKIVTVSKPSACAYTPGGTPTKKWRRTPNPIFYLSEQ